MDKQSKIKEVTKGMYVAEVSKIEISTISKPLLAGKLDTRAQLQEISPGMFISLE